MQQLPFSEACENNKEPILQALQTAFASCTQVLEIGSGTGQHAVHFAPALPQLTWQCTDRAQNLAGIRAWIAARPSPNLLPPRVLDLQQPEWPAGIDAIFSANTAHIMPWPLVQCMLQEGAERLPAGGVFALYGPFNYDGHYTSNSNAAFDSHLRQQDPAQGIRDFEAVNEVASRAGLTLWSDLGLPANNRLLVWRKHAKLAGA